jgi:HK97 family phage major capsid protein
MCAVAQKHSRNLAWMSLPAHDKELVLYAMENMNWGGAGAAAMAGGGNYADICNRKLTSLEQKALIDDAVSGGIEAVPMVFDDMIVTTPYLSGELYPLVNVVPLDMGRRIQGSQAGQVTTEWGGVDDTEITLFDTASYISAFDTTIYRWQGSIRVGLDFLSDTPIDFATFLTNQYGEALLKDLDDVIATGNGTTQPEGISVKSGTTSVAWGGVTSIGNYESLRFGIHKRELTANMARTAVFCGTDTSYQRAMAIPVGASDARRLSNTNSMPNYDGYSWMGRPYKINESLGNTKIFFAVLGRYRMYRRRGLVIKSTMEGDTLVRRNEMLLVAMARYGGQLERGACAAVTSTAPA